MPRLTPVTESTKIRALREAKGLLQQFGFNGFSFQHVADLLGIRKPSLYDHFKSKEVLGQEIVEEYSASFREWTLTIQAESPKEKVSLLFEMFFKFASNEQKICPLSALLADLNSLPKTVRKALMRSCAMQKSWLDDVMIEGQKQKAFRKDIPSEVLAETVMAMALGSQLVARGSGKADCIKSVRVSALKLILAPK